MRAGAAEGFWRGSALGLSAVLLVVLIPPRPARADDTGDALVCLTPANRERLVKAALLLKSAKKGSTPDAFVTEAHGALPLDDWRGKDAEAFGKACAAVADAVRTESGGAGPGSGGGSTWSTLLPLLVGAALTLVTTFLTGGWRERVTEARRQGRVLRSAKAEFLGDARAFLAEATDAQSPVPAAGRMDAARAKLLRALDEMPGVDRSEALSAVRATMTTGVLGAGLTQQWADRAVRDPSTPRHVGLQSELAATDGRIEDGIRAREQPVRTWFSRQWRRITRRAGSA